MICDHGFSSANCPHCVMQIRVKPKIQLVKIAPKEIEMPIPNKEHFTTPKEIPVEPLYNQPKTLSHMPKRLTRNFDLLGNQNSQNPSLFEKRMEEIKTKHDPKNISQDPNSEISIIDLRRKFSKL